MCEFLFLKYFFARAPITFEGKNPEHFGYRLSYLICNGEQLTVFFCVHLAFWFDKKGVIVNLGGNVCMVEEIYEDDDGKGGGMIRGCVICCVEINTLEV